MTKTLLALAAIATVLTATGCCLPLHGGHHYRSERWSEPSRPAPPARPSHDRWDR
jgi:hypothetical protein